MRHKTNAGPPEFWINYMKDKLLMNVESLLLTLDYKISTEKSIQITLQPLGVMIYLFEGFDPNGRVDNGIMLANRLKYIFPHIKGSWKLMILSPGITKGQIYEYTKALVNAKIFNVDIFNPAEDKWLNAFKELKFINIESV